MQAYADLGVVLATARRDEVDVVLARLNPRHPQDQLRLPPVPQVPAQALHVASKLAELRYAPLK